MRRSSLGLLVFFCAGFYAGAVRADDVHLHNGKSFEGVIVVERDEMLDLQFPGGTISIPRSSVRDIVTSDAPYTEYLSRAAELRRTRAGASRWVELARWARDLEMDTAAREAVLEAAAIDPMLAEVAPVMRAFGYELDEATRRWLPFEEAMRSRGLILVDGSWLSREEAADLRRRSEEAARERRRELEVERLERAALEMRVAAAEMELDRARGYNPWMAYDAWALPYAPYLLPVGVHPGFVPGGRADGPHPTPHAQRPPDRNQVAPAGAVNHGGKMSPPGAAQPGSTGLRSASSSRRP